MCKVYVSADPIQYESRTRSLRIHGVLTTIRLENLFWDTLAEAAAREGKTTNQLIAMLHSELSALRGESQNFASFLRVCCLRYLSQVKLHAQFNPAQDIALTKRRPLEPKAVELKADELKTVELNVQSQNARALLPH